MTRTGRPLGEISSSILSLARSEEVWSTKAAQTLQLSRREASVTVHDLARSGRLVEVDRRMVEGARRPVPVYRAGAPAAEPAPEMTILLLDWPRGS